MITRFTFAFAMILAVGGQVVAADNPLLRPLYDNGVFPGLLSDAKFRSEMKTTKDQDKFLDSCQMKWRDGFVKSTNEKLTIETFRKIDRANYEGMLKHLGQAFDEKQVQRIRQITLQKHGMTLFEYEEVRTTVGITSDEVKKLKEVYNRLTREVTTEAGKNGNPKLTPDERSKALGNLSWGVNPRVRATMTADQRKKLQEMIGDPFIAK